MNNLAIFALLAGAAITTQSGLNSQLGVMLKSPLIATMIAFFFSGLFTLIAIVVSYQITQNKLPLLVEVKSIPVYLWFTGSLFSAFGVAMFFYLAPKMGVGSMMSYGLTGQIVIAIISSHFGWFELPVKPINIYKLVGVAALIMGILLINWETHSISEISSQYR